MCPDHEPRKAYFAYGSNMSAAVMGIACREHRFIGAACLPGHRLAFTRRSVITRTGVADIVADAACEVWGALYQLGRGDLERLDHKEGRGSAYERRDLVVRTRDRVPHQAVTYTVVNKEPVEIRPSRDYVRVLLKAARERSLPKEYVTSLEARIVDWADDSAQVQP